MWTIRSPSFCVSVTSNSKPSPTSLPVSPTWPPRFAVERRAVEHDADRLGVADFVELVDKMIAGRLPATMPLTSASASVVVVAEELGASAALASARRSGRSRPSPCAAPCPRLSPCSSIAWRKPSQSNVEVVLGGQRLEQLRRDAVGLIQLGRVARRRRSRAAVACHVVEHPLDAVEARVDRAEEVRFFLLDDVWRRAWPFRRARDTAPSSSRRRPARACAGTARAGPSGGRRAPRGGAAA